jgi:AcrR family transcriptional regulator
MIVADDPRILRTRERVLEAARQLLLSRGLESVNHLNLSRVSGVGRKTIYRHWPTVGDLVYDTLDSANFPRAEQTGNLSVDLLAHLEALRSALVDGPLALVLHSLAARAAIVPELGAVRDRLTNEGCAPIREILNDAKLRGDIDSHLDVETAAGELEGPLFYRVLVRHEHVEATAVATIVDRFLSQRDPLPQPRSDSADQGGDADLVGHESRVRDRPK